MDADITIFDPKTVTDRATYQEPTVPSAGIAYVLVGGAAVVVAGELDGGVSQAAASDRRYDARGAVTGDRTTRRPAPNRYCLVVADTSAPIALRYLEISCMLFSG